MSRTSSSGTQTPTKADNPERLGLEEIVHIANKIGMEYADAKKDSERLELLKPTIRARIMLKLDDGTLPETKLKRLTEINDDYVAFIEQMVEAKGKAEKLRIRYESYKNLFEAKRSLLSYQKAEMKLI